MYDTNTQNQAFWLKNNASDPYDYVVGLYDNHQVIIFGEAHNVRQHKGFVARLLPRLYHEAGVRCLAWEFSNSEDNDRLQALVTARDFDHASLLAFARDQIPDWNSKDHWDLVKSVWRLNASLRRDQEPMRMCGLHPRNLVQLAIDFEQARENPSEREKLVPKICASERFMADQVRTNIIEAGLKGLVLVGRCHDMTLYEFPPDVNYGRPIMGRLLYREYGDAVFQVWPYSGLFPVIESAMQCAERLEAGFTVKDSPFRNITSEAFLDAPGVELHRLAQGVVYLGPMSALEPNATIRGFVTEEMFQKYRDYYNRAYEKVFGNAREVDEYLAVERWRLRNPP